MLAFSPGKATENTSALFFERTERTRNCNARSRDESESCLGQHKTTRFGPAPPPPGSALLLRHCCLGDSVFRPLPQTDIKLKNIDALQSLCHGFAFGILGDCNIDTAENEPANNLQNCRRGRGRAGPTVAFVARCAPGRAGGRPGSGCRAGRRWQERRRASRRAGSARRSGWLHNYSDNISIIFLIHI